MVLSMERWQGKVAIVTGASSGIGAAVAEKLVEAGLKVVGVARRKERMLALSKKLEGKPGELHSFKADVTKEEDILAAFKWTQENIGPIHVLINNAGIARDTNLVEGDTALWKEVLDTNVLGLCVATREAVKEMRKNDICGHIIHINSILGHKVFYFPSVSVYSASKHAVTALTETLRQELNSFGSNIKVTSISPGFVMTEIGRSGNVKLTEDQLKDIRGKMLQSEDIADAVLYVLSTPPSVQVHELIIKPVGEMF